MSSYFRYLIKNIPREIEGEFSAQCFESGAAGVSEVLSFQQGGDTYEVEMVEPDPYVAEVYFTLRPTEAFALGMLSKWPDLVLQVTEEQNKDWLAEWKKGYTAFPLEGRYWVVPSWEKPPQQAGTPLLIDPGMAFGTGTHATTFLASQLLIQSQLCAEKKVIDVGTGTGILAMIAAYEGAVAVVATDIDPEAQRVARENIELNHLAPERVQRDGRKLSPTFRGISVPDLQMEHLTEVFDVVIANIIDGVLVKLRKDLLLRTAKRGHLVLSGILVEREASFLKQFLGEDLRLLRRVQKDEWIGLLLERVL